MSSKAPEASPVLLPTGAGTKASTETPPLRDIESQPSSARSASHVAKSSDPPSASQLSAQHLLRSRGPLVSSIGQTSAPIPSPSMSSTSGPPSVARAANKPLSTLKNFRDSDLFSPLKPGTHFFCTWPCERLAVYAMSSSLCDVALGLTVYRQLSLLGWLLGLFLSCCLFTEIRLIFAVDCTFFIIRSSNNQCCRWSARSSRIKSTAIDSC